MIGIKPDRLENGVFKWAIVGPGAIAREFTHDLALTKNSKHRVAAVIARDFQSAEEFAKEQDVPAIYDNLDEFLKNPDVDAVYIATPHSLHYEQTIACLNKKLPVLCEKPLALNSKQVKEMFDAAVENDTFLLEGLWIRFLPSINRIIDLIDRGLIGEVINIRADMSYIAPPDPDNRFYDPELGGGSLLDLGIYPVFLSLLLLGKPDRVSAAGVLSEKNIDKTCAAFLQYDSGKYAVAESSIVTQTPLEATIYGTKGILRILKQWNEKPQGIQLQLYDGTIVNYPCEWEGRGFQFEIEEVYECLQKGARFSTKFSPEFSLLLMETMDTVRAQIGVRYPDDNF